MSSTSVLISSIKGQIIRRNTLHFFKRLQLCETLNKLTKITTDFKTTEIFRNNNFYCVALQ